MKQKTGKGRLIISLLAVLFIVCAGLLPAVKTVYAAAPGGPMDMKVSYGFDDTAKGDRYLKVTVLLNNRAQEDFTGTLELSTTESSLEVTQYEYPVSVEGETEAKKDLYIPLGLRAEQLLIAVRDARGDEVIRQRQKLNISREISECFVGVFSDAPEQLEYMDAVGIQYGSVKTRLVLLNEENAPENALGYDLLDLVVVSDYDLMRLTDAQHDALSRWIDNGGTLLTGGGSRYYEALGRFASEHLSPPYTNPRIREVNLGMEYAQNAPQESVLSLMCADVNLNNGSTLIQGDGFPLLSYVQQNRGRIAIAAFSLGDVAEFCESRPAFLEKLLTQTFGERKTTELSQMEYHGFSNLYFSVQGLVNTGDAGHLPNVWLYTAVIVLYLLLIGPGIYFYMKKREIHRYYVGGVALCAVFFTGIIYVMGVGTRFREPFFTYATILDISEETVAEETYINVRSPYNKPYSVRLHPDYEVRQVTKSYLYDSMMPPPAEPQESYKTALAFHPEYTELRVRDTVAFTPKLFTLSRQTENAELLAVDGSAELFGNRVTGTIVNSFGRTLEDAALILYGKAIVLGDLAPGQTVDLSEFSTMNYPLGHSYYLAERITGADQYQEAMVTDPAYMQAQERSRLLAFYLDYELRNYFPDARLVAFMPGLEEEQFLAGERSRADGLTMVTAGIELNREKNGLVCRQALEQEPSVISGNYIAAYNSVYSTEPGDSVILEYSLGSDLQLLRVYFEPVSSEFFDPEYPYLSAFTGTMHFYNYDTGHNDPIELKESYTAAELEPYLSPSNTLTVKYVGEGSGGYGWEFCLPNIYAVGEAK